MDYVIAGFNDEMEKLAYIGFGVPIKRSKDGHHNLMLGFPYGVGYSYNIMPKKKVSPSLGVGLTGPFVGLSFGKSKKKKRRRRRKK